MYVKVKSQQYPLKDLLHFIFYFSFTLFSRTLLRGARNEKKLIQYLSYMYYIHIR